MAKEALGMIETRGWVGVFEWAGDQGELHNGSRRQRQMCISGRVTVMVRGDVGAVKASVEAGASSAKRVGEVVSVHVIASPHDDVEGILPQA